MSGGVASSAEYLRVLARARASWARREWTTAASMWEQVVAANPVNGDHWDRLARARLRGGDYAGAITAFEQVTRLGVSATREDVVAPGVLSYYLACCHARLGQTEPALHALATAREQGHRNISIALTDDNLESLRQNPRLHSLTGGGTEIGAGDPGRHNGWRHDVELVVREIRRRAPRSADIPLPASEPIAEITQRSDAEIVAELSKLVAGLDDGHAYVEVPENNVALSRGLPLQFYLFEEGLFIVAATAEYRPLLGAQVVAIDRRPVSEVLDALSCLVAHDNEYGIRERVVQVLRRLPIVHAVGQADRPDTVALRLLAGNDAPVDVMVRSEPGAWLTRNELPAPPGWLFFPDTLPGTLPLYLRNCGAAYWYEQLPDEPTLYFQFNSTRDDAHEPFAAFSARMFQHVEEHDIERLVVDLRWNGGGNNMLVQPLIHGLIRCQRTNRPGGLFVIIGRRTFSAAQYTATAIEANTHATFVGEPTGSRPNFVGETTPFVLPYSGVRVNVSDLYWQNSWPLDRRRWIAPELYAPPTFAAFAANRDPALEAILACRDHLPA